MILYDDGLDVNATNMNNLIKASGCTVEGYWPTLFSKMVNNIGVDSLIAMGSGSIGSGAAPMAANPGAAAGPVAGDGAAVKKEEKVEEDEEEEGDMDFDLFG